MINKLNFYAMKYNYTSVESKNEFKHKTRKRIINGNTYTSNKDIIGLYYGSIESIPIPISLDRIRKIQKEYLENNYWSFTKRGFDILFSLAIIVFVFSWIYPLMYVLIKLESKGPIIFKQKRNGLNQKQFDCYKFRSMTVNDYSETLPTFKGDPRITRIGKFIRKYSIDELPQFINVLKGEMTIVGPRPHMISETDSFNKLSEDFYKRHEVKPGITGLAQVNNCRGEINCLDDLLNRLKYDLLYIKEASISLDLKIIKMTCTKMVIGDKTAR